jgi:hypothetical protein
MAKHQNESRIKSKSRLTFDNKAGIITIILQLVILGAILWKLP